MDLDTVDTSRKFTEDVVVAHVWDIGADTTGTSLAREWGFPWMTSMTEGPSEGHAWRHDRRE